MNIILSSRNPSKITQIKPIFEGTDIAVLSLEDAGIPGEAVEDGDTLEENALKKARFAHQPGTWTMADDTGIFITALGGLPGVRSARWAGETATTEEITQHTLKQLEGKTDRSAIFRTVVAIVDPDGGEHLFEGEIPGTLLESPHGAAQPKMPYSPIFVPEGGDQVWGEMSVEYENSISHRGKAFRKAREFLTSRI